MNQMKIDVFNHIFPRRFFDRLNEVSPDYKDMGKRSLRRLQPDHLDRISAD